MTILFSGSGIYYFLALFKEHDFVFVFYTRYVSVLNCWECFASNTKCLSCLIVDFFDNIGYTNMCSITFVCSCLAEIAALVFNRHFRKIMDMMNVWWFLQALYLQHKSQVCTIEFEFWIFDNVGYTNMCSITFVCSCLAEIAALVFNRHFRKIMDMMNVCWFSQAPYL